MTMNWRSSKSEKADAYIAETYAMVAQKLDDQRLRRRFFLLFAGLNTMIWLLAVLAPNSINYIVWSIVSQSNKVGLAILGIPFAAALFSTYALLRMKFTALEDNKQLESHMMASYQYQADSTRRWFVWVGSAAAGAANVLLLIGVNSYLADRF